MVKTFSIALFVALIIVPKTYAIETLYCSATAYTLAEDECGKPPWHEAYGVTASGEFVKEGFIAVDTNIIPMHSIVYIEGAWEYEGLYIAKDTGGAIKGNKIDIFMWDKQKALKFGRRNVKVHILRKGEYMDFRKFYPMADNVKLPERGTKLSAGYDFYLKDTVTIKPHTLTMVNSGVRVSMLDDDALLLFARSSLSKKGLLLANSVAVVDADYENDILFPLYNLTDEDVVLKAGERVVQGVFIKYHTMGDIVTAQRTGGFGSTNKVLDKQ